MSKWVVAQRDGLRGVLCQKCHEDIPFTAESFDSGRL